MFRNLDKTLNINREIVFGPFIGELGWEIIRFSGIARYYKKLFPNKKMFICTRRNRYDLYSDLFTEEESILFDIEGDYSTYMPSYYNTPSKEIKDKVLKPIYRTIERQTNSPFIVDVNRYHHRMNIFDFKKVNYEYNPRKEHKNIIEYLISINKDKIPILLFPRNRIEKQHEGPDPMFNYRNWGNSNWNAFYDLLESENKYLVFVSGISPSYIKPINRRNIIDLESYSTKDNKITTLGLTIEALINSNICVSSQSSITILANLLLTPSLTFGNEKYRLEKEENPFGNRFIYADESYFITPEKLFEKMKDELRELYEVG